MFKASLLLLLVGLCTTTFTTATPVPEMTERCDTIEACKPGDNSRWLTYCGDWNDPNNVLYERSCGAGTHCEQRGVSIVCAAN